MASFLRRLYLCQAQAAVHHLDLAAPLTHLLTLPVDLAHLLHHLPLGGDLTHLVWLLHALSASLSTHHSSTSSARPAAQLPQSKHLLQRADHIVSLLDVSYTLKHVAADLNRHVDRLDHALQSLEEALQFLPPTSCSSSSSSSSSTAHPSQRTSGWRLRRGTRRLAACLQNQRMLNAELNKAIEEASASLLSARRRLRRVAPPRGITEPTGVPLTQAMHGAALTTLLILAAALSSLAPKCKSSDRIIARSCKLKAGLLEKASPWAAPLTQMQQGLMQAKKRYAGAGCQELKELHASADLLLLDVNESLDGAIADNQMVAVSAEVKRVRKSVQALQDRMLDFGGDMGQLSQALLNLRVALLDSAAAHPPP